MHVSFTQPMQSGPGYVWKIGYMLLALVSYTVPPQSTRFTISFVQNHPNTIPRIERVYIPRFHQPLFQIDPAEQSPAKITHSKNKNNSYRLHYYIVILRKKNGKSRNIRRYMYVTFTFSEEQWQVYFREVR